MAKISLAPAERQRQPHCQSLPKPNPSFGPDAALVGQLARRGGCWGKAARRPAVRDHALEPTLPSDVRRNIWGEQPTPDHPIRSALPSPGQRAERSARRSHRPIRVKAARCCPASIRNRMANDQAQNYLSRSLAPHTGVVSRATGAARRLVADGVAPTPVRISLRHRAVRERSRESCGRVERAIPRLVRRGPSTVPTADDTARRT